MLRLPDRGCKMFKLPNVDMKFSYYNIGVTKCLLRSVCYKMCGLRLWWQPSIWQHSLQAHKPMTHEVLEMWFNRTSKYDKLQIKNIYLEGSRKHTAV